MREGADRVRWEARRRELEVRPARPETRPQAHGAHRHTVPTAGLTCLPVISTDIGSLPTPRQWRGAGDGAGAPTAGRREGDIFVSTGRIT